MNNTRTLLKRMLTIHEYAKEGKKRCSPLYDFAGEDKELKNAVDSVYHILLSLEGISEASLIDTNEELKEEENE